MKWRIFPAPWILTLSTRVSSWDLSRAGRLPNFDHCGKYPCSIISSSVTLSEAMRTAIHLSHSLSCSPAFSSSFFCLWAVYYLHPSSPQGSRLPLSTEMDRWETEEEKQGSGRQLSRNYWGPGRRPGSRATFLFPQQRGSTYLK